MKTVKQFEEETKNYGIVGNAKNICELGPKMMGTAGIVNQMELANEIIASATFLAKACRIEILEKFIEVITHPRSYNENWTTDWQEQFDLYFSGYRGDKLHQTTLVEMQILERC